MRAFNVLGLCEDVSSYRKACRIMKDVTESQGIMENVCCPKDQAQIENKVLIAADRHLYKVLTDGIGQREFSIYSAQ